MKTFFFVALAAFALSSCGGDGGSSPGMSNSLSVNSDMIVQIQPGSTGKGEAAFGQNPLIIKKGTRVTWDNMDSVAHAVTADDNSFDSGTLNPGEGVYSHVFTEAGTIPYHCSIHGATSMSGVIEVTEE